MASANPNPGNDSDVSTGFDCALCEKPNAVDKMARCDKCHKWHHFQCVGLSHNTPIEEMDWFCPACEDTENAGADSDDVAAAESAEKKAEEEHQKKLEQLREVRRVAIRRQLEREREQREVQLELERELLQMRKEAEQEFLQRRRQLYSEFGDLSLERENAAGGGQAREQSTANAENGLGNNQSYPQFSTPNGAGQSGPENTPQNPRYGVPPFPPVVIPGLPPQPWIQYRPNVPPYAPLPQPPQPQLPAQAPVLSKAQIAARKGPFAKLPSFTGKPEEWPIFYSSYMNGNAACNWSNLENLGRLQEAIKGRALEVVRSRLLLPELVPTVIEELRDQFGRPEHLLHALLQKAKKVESPRFGNAQSFNDYGTVVKQLADHLVAVGLVHHLTNPFLVAELVNKLPHTTQTEWVRYSRGQVVSLTTFSAFVAAVVAEVNEAALMASLAESSSNPKQKEKDKKPKVKEQGFLNAHVAIEQPSPQSKGQQRNKDNSPRKPCRSCNRTDHRLRYCDDFQKLEFNDKMKIVDKWKLCKMCLNEHADVRCHFKGHCGIGSCKERHHDLLHPPTAAPGNSATATVSTSCNVHDAELNHPVIFRVVPIKIYNGKRVLEVIAFLDEGSSYSLMDSSIAEELRLSGTWKPILVKWTAGMSRLERESKSIDVTISAKGSQERFLLRNVHTVQQLQLPEQKVRFAEVAARFKHLSGLPIDDEQSGAPKILIGLKHLHVYAPLESRIGQPGEPIAVRTKLGWTIYGPQNNDEVSSGFAGTHVAGGLTDQDLHELLRNHYTLEESGVCVTVLPESKADRRARELLEKTTIRVGDRFETGLLWKNDDPQLPDSLPMALRRHKALERKLEKNPELQQNVEKQIEEYQRKGYAHIATPSELAQAEPGKVWHLPLNVVVNPKKPGKVRLVWDAKACVQGKSLNSELLTGPDLLTSLVAVTCGFREFPIAFGGDIEEMYHQLQIRPSDRSAQRFVYRPKSSKEPVVFVMDVATFGSTCSPCSAQYVKNRNAQEFADRYPDAAQAIIGKHYVDDYLDSTSTIRAAIQRASEVALIHSKAGFKIRNWVSNSAEFLEHFGERTGEKVVHFNSDKINGTERVLGMAWDTVDDVFLFANKVRDDIEQFMSGERQLTKRDLLSIVMSFFDPLGLWAHYTVHGKLIIQGLWRKGCKWDEVLDDESMQLWMRWILLLPQVQAMSIPRCYFSDAKPADYTDIQLHIFADASEAAYGCVAYLRAQVNGQPRCALVMAKSKVAPLQYVSVPRMELLAAEMASNMSVSVKANHSLPVKRVVIWIDSCTVLSWIHSEHWKYKQFVACRLGNIRNNTQPGDYRWVPTKYNIADELTKWGNEGPMLEQDSTWVNGPDFLYRPEEEWPQRKQPVPGVKDELRAHYLFHEIAFSDEVLDVTRFSRWARMVRAIAYTFRFLSNCRRKSRKQPIETVRATVGQQKLLKKDVPSVVTPLTSEEHQRAENYLWRMAQREGFPDEVKTLKKNRALEKSQWHSIEKSSPLYRLCPFLDGDDVIRAEGRTAYADFLPFELRLSIVLPKDHAITRMLVQHYHNRYGHANAETVFNELRQRFEIENLRSLIKQVTKHCMLCRVKKCQPAVPRMAPLPRQRLKPHLRPFTYVGVDYFGPVIVTVGRRSEKRWVCLFTCMVTRAIHMEVAHSLSGPSCMMAITRFIRKRGPVLEFFSDNGTNFKAASKELAQQIQCISMDCAEIFTDARTRWNFNPPSAPHMGGVWERLVRSAKEALKAIHDGGKLNDEILLTVLAQVEDMVNSRPLTYVSQDAADTEALTPNHFIRGLPAGERMEVNVATDHAAALRDNYKRSLELADLLWEMWLKAYIPTINHQRVKWLEEKEVVKIGDLVYVADSANRRTWVRGRVAEVYRGIDGNIRQAKVELAGDNELIRPVAKLAVMELGSKSGQIPGPGPELREGVLAELATLPASSSFLSPSEQTSSAVTARPRTSSADRLSRSLSKTSRD